MAQNQSLSDQELDKQIEKEAKLIDKLFTEKRNDRTKLKELDLFILDNSLRESSVAQLRGHTLENKWNIYNEIKKCGIKYIIVASFSHMTRVDDVFVTELVEKGEDMSCTFSFAEAFVRIKDGVYDAEKISIGFTKSRELKIQNIIIELDLANSELDWGKFTIDDIGRIILSRIEWCKTHLSEKSKVLINLRDFANTMIADASRILKLVKLFGTQSPEMRPFGIIFEEPTGKALPEEVAPWIRGVRNVMDLVGWNDCHFLVHIHEKWGMADSVQLECLISGANGIWASICIEGAAMGHACSSVTAMNLVRMGNKKILENYNCTYFRKAAISITQITTGQNPHKKQVLYGERSLDIAFGAGTMGNSEDSVDFCLTFDLAEFFGERAPLRISTLSTLDMIVKRMTFLFGENPDFTEERAHMMKQNILDDLIANIKQEYMSKVGLAVLYERSGGTINNDMLNVLEIAKVKNPRHQALIGEVRAIWDEWDLKDDVQKDELLQYDNFYNGFMAPYFACYRCEDTKKALAAIDMDNDNQIDWKEFELYLKWAINEYPEVKDTDELLSITFCKGIMPVMRDELEMKAKMQPPKQ